MRKVLFSTLSLGSLASLRPQSAVANDELMKMAQTRRIG